MGVEAPTSLPKLIDFCDCFSPDNCKDPQELVRQLESCLKLNEAYEQQYRQTKTKLQQTPRGKQFDFSETEIFGEVLY